MSHNFINPYTPGAGHAPPFLAGRDKECAEFAKLLKQVTIFDNALLTGLRGIGKTVLLSQFRSTARSANWAWVGSDISESSGSESEDKLIERIITDLATLTSNVKFPENTNQQMGFVPPPPDIIALDYLYLKELYKNTPGLPEDRLKSILRISWHALKTAYPNLNGLIFAYDEAQNLADNAPREQHPLSLFLDVFQALQREELPIMLVLTGLPTLFPKLVDARTYAERMFKVIELTPLDDAASRDAILKPLDEQDCPIRFDDASVKIVIDVAQGYPYFIQFICREVYEIWTEDDEISVSMHPIIAKLDRDFFAGRWDRATDRQRDLMRIIAVLPNANKEFTTQEIVEKAKADNNVKPFKPSHVTQILNTLITKGLVYRNRHGKYMLAVPLMADFIRRL